MNKFYSSLKDAKKYEIETLKYLDFDKFEFNDDNRFDIKIIKNKIIKLIEVKKEILASKTGNIAIEYFCRGKPSGIDVTQAEDYYYYVVYKDRYRLFKLPVIDIKNIIKNKLYVRECIGGDDMASKMFLISIKSIEKYELDLSKCKNL